MKTICLLAAVVVVGCGPQLRDPYTEHRNENNGAHQQLNFGGFAIPVGLDQPVTLWVERQEFGTFECGTASKPTTDFIGIPNGSYQYKECTRTTPYAPMTRLVSATCDDGACEASVSGTDLTFTGKKFGRQTIHVTAELSDGGRVTDDYVVEFAEPDRIELLCFPSSICVSGNALLVGTRTMMLAMFHRGATSLLARAQITFDPPGIFEVDPPRANDTVAYVRLRAVKPGTTTITLTHGKVSRSLPARAVDATEVVGVRVHTLRPELRQLDASHYDPGTSPIGAEASTTIPLNEPMVAVWQLADGTPVLADARRITTPTPGIVLDDGGTLETLAVRVWITTTCKPGPVTLKGSLGQATLDWTFQSACD